MNEIDLPLDYFGAAGAYICEQLFSQSTNARKRKSAFNNICRILKASGAIRKSHKIAQVSLAVNYGGSIRYVVRYIEV